jgi:hypothetical protein
MAGILEILLYVGGSIAFALVSLLITKKFAKPIDVKETADFLLASVPIIGTLVSVVLGLLVSTSVDRYREMESCVDNEATTVAAIYRNARGLPHDPRFILQSLCIEYCDHAVNDEWPDMRQGKMSDALTITYGKLNDAIVALHPADLGQANLQQSMLTAASKVAENRRARLVFIKSDWMQRLLPILVVSALIVLAITYMYVDSKPSRLQGILVSFVAIALGSNIGVIIMLSRPFSGSWSIEPETFAANAKFMREYLHVDDAVLHEEGEGRAKHPDGDH